MCDKCEAGDCTTCGCPEGTCRLEREHDSWVALHSESD